MTNKIENKKINKMDEEIIVVNREILFENEALKFQGVIIDKDSVKYMMAKFEDFTTIRRGDAEVNPEWKQPIPYTIIRRGDEVFIYERLKGGGEERLHSQLSIGVGGHMNDLEGTSSWEETLEFNMYRELGEELEIISSRYPEPKILGLINDEENEVGKVHICILTIIDLPKDAEVNVRETDTLDGYWIRIRDLKKVPLVNRLESWSQIASLILCREEDQ